MRRNLIELGAMLAVSAALIVGAVDRAHDYVVMNGRGENRVAVSLSDVGIDRIELPTR